MLAGDDRAIDKGIVRCRHEVSLRSVLGSPADGEGRAQWEVELAGLIRVVPLYVPQDDAEDWGVSKPCAEHGGNDRRKLTRSHEAGWTSPYGVVR
jgi:hypothetical protein